ncbi:phosphoenolpyruvate--protein phosphotransferase [Niveispirillum lacus]|uniref:phosphoenolpyruvate--protein phosphotransferase n=2 Tax=Niveispirillum lacus TaxID=1981099 RepID=A0A255Z3N6_9PROT|nr:phosphoenolpyruvate--protein phosphotransferase [Niveispirillum lacus]OYQ36041.1 phosphoenolpyruvate--protein phosphotransferase [Niveispirillum lacus]
MAGSGSAQGRLDKIVMTIAHEMTADVCSCYVMRAGEVLELFATIGLNPDAVHKTRMRVGEGLIGDVAAHSRPIALANAPSHPNFAYRPETGEDPFNGFLAVPILRGGRVRGVLAIQHKDRREYDEQEVETLQTIAMIVAELVVVGELVDSRELSVVNDLVLLPSRVEGTSLNRGVGMGVAVLHRPQLTIRQMVADDPETELARLKEAVTSMHSAIDQMLIAVGESDSEHAEIMQTYRMVAADRGWLNRIREAIRSGLTAEAAVQRVQDDNSARMAQVADPYIRDRLLDLNDITNRLLQHLAGKPVAATGGTLPDEFVLVARNLGPAELLDYDRRRLRALVLEEGSAYSHVAIVARALDIPVVGQAADILRRVEPLDFLIVDGDNGQVFVRPADDIQAVFVASLAARQRRQAEYARLRDLPAVTLDGQHVTLMLNCGLLIDLPHLKTTGADGVGLYRTEIPFMVRPSYPDVATQFDNYSKVLEEAGDKPVNFRTLDVGGDKTLPYFPELGEENPALGWRAIRIGLDRPSMLRKQLRAMLMAGAGREVRIMFPMVATVAEFIQARRILDLEVKRLKESGHPGPANLKVGVMMEVPALLFQLDALLPLVDFMSVGSNDMLQYLFASDRGNPMLNNRYDLLSPALLRVLKMLVEQCGQSGVTLSLCGEMASKPLDAMALLGVGIRHLSMSAPAFFEVKSMLRTLHAGDLSAYMDRLYHLPVRSLRPYLKAYAADHGIVLG